MSSLEVQVQGQGKILGDFIQESRKTTEDLFNGLNRISVAVEKGKATDWQQLGVLFTLVSLAGTFIYVAFIGPMQEAQKRTADQLQASQAQAREVELRTVEKCHQTETAAAVLAARLQTKGVIP